MSNHVHLLIERQLESTAGVMQRLLTGYSQYYNRKHRHIGHVFQGRHKAVFCQSENYLGQLVRYIHLNPVRAGMVATAEEYPYSSQRAYLEETGSDLRYLCPFAVEARGPSWVSGVP